VLYLDSDASEATVAQAVSTIEEYLCSIHHYRYCRRLGQLGPIRAVRVERGWDRYQAALVARGMRVGDIKPVKLDLKGAAREAFAATKTESVVQPGEAP